ncbi:MAG: putative metal-dependent hydrolase [Acidobacteriota bacterium]
MENLQYPIGKFQRDPAVTAEKRERWIRSVAGLPERLEQAVAGLSDAQLDTAYRPEGWTVRQLVHHIADSHINAYVRVRLALTEDKPTIKAYDQAAWAQLADARSAPLRPSLAIISAVHERWVLLLRSLEETDFARPFHHPEWGDIDLDTTLQMYAWHGDHHLAHITGLRKRKGW